MRKIFTLILGLVCISSFGANVTNYPTTTTFDSSTWFLLSSPSAKTNYNLPGNYVASQANLTTVSNRITTTSNALVSQISIASNAITTNTAALIAAVPTLSYPFVTVRPDGTFVAGGNSYANPGSTTAGIQEAIDYLLGITNGIRASGGTIYLSPGTFFTTSAIRIPGDNPGTNMVAIHIEGAGKLSSGITYVGTDPESVIIVNPTNSAANFSSLQTHCPDTITFVMRNLFVSSTTNACTNLVSLKCPAPGVSTKWGAIESAEISRCWFFYGATTNTSWVQNLTTHNQENLIGIEVDLNYNDQIVIRDCSFVSLGHGISYACDWGHIESCVFENCPAVNVTNAWPVTSPYFVPATVVFKESTHGSLVNGHQWWISGNEFIGCPLPYLSLIDSVNPWIANKVITYNDAIENVIVGSPIVATKGGSFTFVNPRVHAAESFPPVSGYNGANPYMPGYLVTNVANYSTWTNVPIPTRSDSNTLFTVADAQYKTTTGDYTNQGTIYATKFAGDGSLLTGVGGGSTNLSPWSTDINGAGHILSNAVFTGTSSNSTLRGTTITLDTFNMEGAVRAWDGSLLATNMTARTNASGGNALTVYGNLQVYGSVASDTSYYPLANPSNFVNSTQVASQIAASNAPPTGITNWYSGTTLIQSNTVTGSWGYFDDSGNMYWTNVTDGWYYKRTNGLLYAKGMILDGTGTNFFSESYFTNSHFVGTVDGTVLSITNGLLGTNGGTISGELTAAAYSTKTNAWSLNSAIPYGTNELHLVSGAATGGITGIANFPAGGGAVELRMKATGDITFTNHVNIHSSDFKATRTITNGNTCFVAIAYDPDTGTNMAIVQFK